jgi:prevent-host-death family protein
LIVLVISVRMTYMKTMASAAELKAHLSEYLRAAEHGRAVLITRHGKAVAALVSADELALSRCKPDLSDKAGFPAQ